MSDYTWGDIQRWETGAPQPESDMRHDVRCTTAEAHSDHECFSHTESAISVRDDGTYQILSIGELEDLEFLQRLVGGYIETVPRALMLFPNIVIICNEGPPSDDMELNGMASNLTTITQYIKGTIIIAGVADEAGDITPIPLLYFNYVKAMCDLHAEAERLQASRDS